MKLTQNVGYKNWYSKKNLIKRKGLLVYIFRKKVGLTIWDDLMVFCNKVNVDSM